jgi:hypothetical protein
LPDFLDLEHGGELVLLGQEELDISVLEAGLRDQISQHRGASVWSDLETERILLAAARVGQRMHLALPLADAIQSDPLARQYYGRPPLREVILLPEGAQAPARKYLDWHRQEIFIA